MNNLLEKFDKLVLFFILYSVAFVTFFGTLQYTLPFVLAILISLLLKKPTRVLVSKFKINAAIAALTTTSLFSIISITILSLIITLLVKELYILTRSIQSFFDPNYIMQLVDKLMKFYNNLDAGIVETINNNLSTMSSKAATFAIQATSSTASFLLNTATSIPYILTVILFTILSTYFITKGFSTGDNKLRESLPKESSKRILLILNETKRMLGNYLISYMLIIFITFVETLIGFSILGINFALLLSLLAAALDLLPILGIASVYFPLAIYYFISGNYFVTGGLIALYVFITIFRQIIEPKIVSNSLGISPVASLVAIFVGLKAYGFMGMFFCMFLLVFYNIFKKVDLL
ncbi:MAG: sporulation integral membrane protein YtvI [Clostridiaceae bacterium]